jgi:hypothetical protein
MFHNFLPHIILRSTLISKLVTPPKLAESTKQKISIFPKKDEIQSKKTWKLLEWPFFLENNRFNKIKVFLRFTFEPFSY